MPIEKTKLENLLKEDSELRKQRVQRTLPRVKTKDDGFVKEELSKTFDDSEALISGYSLEKSVPFILWNDLWNKHGVFGSQIEGTNMTYRRYNRGAKIFVDFGCGNIKTELSFPHPAIVLYNYAKTVIVIPTTSDDKKSILTEEFEDSIIKVKSDGTIFRNDTIINIPQMRMVEKQRIISDLKCNVKNYIVCNEEIKRLNSRLKVDTFNDGMNLLECIQMNITYMFSGSIIERMNKLEKERKMLIEHINELKSISLNEIDNAVECLKSKINDIQKTLTCND
jgi:hypothetical protein